MPLTGARCDRCRCRLLPEEQDVCFACERSEFWDSTASRCAAAALPAFDAMLLEQTSPARIEKLGKLFR